MNIFRNDLSTEQLIELLKNDSEDRYIAAKALGFRGDKRAIPYLYPLFEDPNEHARGAAVYAVGQLGVKNAFDLLIKMLDDPDDYVRRKTIQALGLLGDERAFPLVFPFLTDENILIIRSTTEALAQLKNPAAIQPLVNMLGEANTGIHGHTLYFIIDAIASFGEAALLPLLDALDDPKLRTGAAMVLGKLEEARAVEPLMALLANPEIAVETRVRAVSALGQIGDFRAYDLLCQISDTDSSVSPYGYSVKHEADYAIKRLIEKKQAS